MCRDTLGGKFCGCRPTPGKNIVDTHQAADCHRVRLAGKAVVGSAELAFWAGLDDSLWDDGSGGLAR